MYTLIVLFVSIQFMIFTVKPVKFFLILEAGRINKITTLRF
jgi:hypothetical protein